MERNLESIIEEIAQNEELSKEFTVMDEIDEIYAYCKEMGLNSSEEEFDEEVSSMIDNFDSNYSKIGDFELENVAGGSMLDKNFNKVVASALSALTIAGVGASSGNFAYAASGGPASTVSASASEKSQLSKKEKFNKIKNSVLSFCKKHKIAVGATTAAAIILVAIYGSVALYKKDANPLHWFRKKSGRFLNVIEMGELYSLKDINKMSPQLKEVWDQLSEEDKKDYLAKRDKYFAELEEGGYYKNQTRETGDGSSSDFTGQDVVDGVMSGLLPKDSPEFIHWKYASEKKSGKQLTFNQAQYNEAYSTICMDRMKLIDELDDCNARLLCYADFADKLKNSIESGQFQKLDYLVNDKNVKSMFSHLSGRLSELNTGSIDTLPKGVSADQLNEFATYFQKLGGFSS